MPNVTLPLYKRPEVSITKIEKERKIHGKENHENFCNQFTVHVTLMWSLDSFSTTVSMNTESSQLLTLQNTLLYSSSEQSVTASASPVYMDDAWSQLDSSDLHYTGVFDIQSWTRHISLNDTASDESRVPRADIYEEKSADSQQLHCNNLQCTERSNK